MLFEAGKIFHDSHLNPMSVPADNRFLVELARGLLHPLQPEPTAIQPRIVSLPQIHCVLFDVYGTLLVSAAGEVGTVAQSWGEDAAQEALQAAGLQIRDPRVAAEVVQRLPEVIRRHQQSSPEEYPEVDIRRVWKELLQELAAAHLIAGDLSRQTIMCVALVFECRTNPVWPMPHAAEVLRRLHQAGVILGLVSNAQFYTPIVIEAAFGADLRDLGFRPELCSYSYAMGTAKPGTRLFEPVVRALADYFGLSAADCLYVGNDMRNDILPAHQMGMRTVLFAGDRRSLRLREDDPACSLLQPEGVITSLEQIELMVASEV